MNDTDADPETNHRADSIDFDPAVDRIPDTSPFDDLDDVFHWVFSHDYADDAEYWPHVLTVDDEPLERVEFHNVHDDAEAVVIAAVEDVTGLEFAAERYTDEGTHTLVFGDPEAGREVSIGID